MDGVLSDAVSRLFGDHADPAALWAAIAEAGLPRALVREAAGGHGVPPAEALGLLRHAGAAACLVPLAETMLAAWLLGEAGLPIQDGPLALACADGLNVRGDRLAGAAHAVGWARDAAAIVVLAPPCVAVIPRGVCAIEPGENLAGEPRDSIVVDVKLADIRCVSHFTACDAARLRAVRAAAGAQMIAGALAKICAMTIRHARQRTQFGKPLAAFQAVQQSLATLAAESAAASAAAELCAEAFADGIRMPAIAAGRARACEAAGVGAAIAHQIHGAIGFTDAHDLHRMTRRLWAWRDEHGGETEWQALLGRHVAAAGPAKLWAGITAL